MAYEDTDLTKQENKRVAGQLGRLWAGVYLTVLDEEEIDPAWAPVIQSIGEEMTLINTDFPAFMRKLEACIVDCQDANDAAVTFAAFFVYNKLFYDEL